VQPHYKEMRGTGLLLVILSVTWGAPAKTDPDSEVELVQPVENDPTEVGAGNEAEDGTVVIVVGPGSSEDYDYDQSSNAGGFGGFGGLPSLAGSFGGFGENRPEIRNIDLSNLFGNSETEINLSDLFGSGSDDSGLTLSVSLEPAEEPGFGQGNRGNGFSLTDLMKSISSGNQQNVRGGFGFGNRRPQFGSRNQRPGGFRSRNHNQDTFNLGGFLSNGNGQPKNSFADIFGSVSLKPQTGLGDIIGSLGGVPLGGSSSLGAFGGLRGAPWNSFQNIFTLYNMPKNRGYKEIFGPVYGHRGGCGLCQLFTSDNVPGEGAIVSIEMVGENPDYYYEEPINDYEVYEEETIPGGSVVRVNETTIRVLDENGEGIYFVLSEDPAFDEVENETAADGPEYDEYEPNDDEVDDNSPPVASTSNDDDDDGQTDYEMNEDDISKEDTMADENTPADESMDEENTPTENGMVDDFTPTEDELLYETNETTDGDTIGNSEPVTEANTDIELTTQFEEPAIVDKGRFDIANDKIVSPPEVNYEATETYPDTERDTALEEAEQIRQNALEEAKQIIKSALEEAEKVRKLAQKAIEKVPEEEIVSDIAPEGNNDNINPSGTDSTESQTSPTLDIDEVDEGLL